MNFEELKERDESLYALTSIATAYPFVRLISVEWDADPLLIHFYVDGEITEEVDEAIEEPFCHTGLEPIFRYDVKKQRIDRPQPIEYVGECFFARNEREVGNQPMFLKEHSQLLFPDAQILSQPRELIQIFRYPQLQGWAEFVNFKEPIGYYLNPTTRTSTLTTKAVIYHGKNRDYVIPAATNLEWYEQLEKTFANDSKNNFGFFTHLMREAYRALIGRIVPGLLSYKIHWTSISRPYLLGFYVADELSDEDRENIELIWCEVLAGVHIKSDVQLAIQFISSKMGYNESVGGSWFYSKALSRADQPSAKLSKFQSIERRLRVLEAIFSTLTGNIPVNICYISVEWSTLPVYIHFQFHNSPDVTREEKIFFVKLMDECCLQIDITPLKPFCDFAWSDTSRTCYGECIFAREPRENGKISQRDSGLYVELSTCAHFDIPFLLEQKTDEQVLKIFQTPAFQGQGELVDFETPIGTYLNPTTHESQSTTKAVVYYGVKKTEIIPAVPDPHWFVELQNEFAKEHKVLDFKVHIQREAHRALLGRVPTLLVAMTLSYEKEPYAVTFYITEPLSRADRLALELVWFEMMAGMPQELEFQAHFIQATHAQEVNLGDYCVYLRKEIEA